MRKHMTLFLFVTALVVSGLAAAQVATSPQVAPGVQPPKVITTTPILLPRGKELKKLMRLKLNEPSIQRVPISTRIAVPKPTVEEMKERPLDLKAPVLVLPRLDRVDPRKFGFSSLADMKVSARQALGLPKDFPITIREHVDTKYGERQGLLITGANPLMLDAQGAPLTIENFRKKLTQDAGSVLGKPKQP